MASWLVWRIKDEQFSSGKMAIGIFGCAIDQMGEGDVGWQGIYGSLGIEINLLVPRSAGNHSAFCRKLKLGNCFIAGSLVGADTCPALKLEVQRILSFEKIGHRHPEMVQRTIEAMG